MCLLLQEGSDTWVTRFLWVESAKRVKYKNKLTDIYTRVCISYLKVSFWENNSFSIKCPEGTASLGTLNICTACAKPRYLLWQQRFPTPRGTHTSKSSLWAPTPLNPHTLNCFTVPVPFVLLTIFFLLDSPGILFYQECPAAPQPPCSPDFRCPFQGLCRKLC